MEDNAVNIQGNPDINNPIPDDEKKIAKNETAKKNKGSYKTVECRVLSYDGKTMALDIDFNGYGIRIKNVKDFYGDSVTIKYRGEIGKPNFDFKLQV